MPAIHNPQVKIAILFILHEAISLGICLTLYQSKKSCGYHFFNLQEIIKIL